MLGVSEHKAENVTEAGKELHFNNIGLNPCLPPRQGKRICPKKASEKSRLAFVL
jgi:hypothetical protein